MTHQSFVDWMKALGMLLIVVGHVYGDPLHIFNSVSQPIYTKQLGVAFFVFITGWSLANETRDGFRVVFNRLFSVYFYGLLFAVLLSGFYFITEHDLNESNYLPFIAGVNVFFNYFPANPTTWYIGTYLHLLLFWFFFIRGREIGKRHLLIAFLVENVIRCMVLALDKSMVAYMLFPNWLTIFLLGGYLHKKRDTAWNPKIVLLFVAWALILACWSSSFNLLSFDKTFPFRKLFVDNVWALPLQSLLISIVYLANTLLVFKIVRSLPRFRLVSFFARNTLIIFIAHMPVIYIFSDYIYALFDSRWLNRVVLIFILYVGIAVASEFIQKSIIIKFLCEKSWDVLQRASQKILPNK